MPLDHGASSFRVSNSVTLSDLSEAAMPHVVLQVLGPSE